MIWTQPQSALSKSGTHTLCFQLRPSQLNPSSAGQTRSSIQLSYGHSDEPELTSLLLHPKTMNPLPTFVPWEAPASLGIASCRRIGLLHRLFWSTLPLGIPNGVSFLLPCSPMTSHFWLSSLTQKNTLLDGIGLSSLSIRLCPPIQTHALRCV